MGILRFDLAVMAFAVVILMFALPGPTVAAPAAGPGSPTPVLRGPITTIQTGTCGCEGGKQKIWKTQGGQQVCVVTNLPCTVP